MNSFRNGLYWLSVIVLLMVIGGIIWYTFMYSQRPKPEENGTLVIGVQTIQTAKEKTIDSRGPGETIQEEREGQVPA